MAIPLHYLMLEDSPSDAELILHALRQAGYDPIGSRVEIEQAYGDALLKAPDIILADFSMPEFDALRALKILQDRQLDIPFIVISGTIGDERAVQIMQRGATDYIIKDRMARLGQAVTRALEQKHMRVAKRLAEQSLRANEELMRSVFDYANIAMLVSDLDGRLIRANNALVELLGYSQAEILQLSTSDIIHPDDLAESHIHQKTLIAGEKRFFEIERRYAHKDGRVLRGLANTSLVHDPHGWPLYFVGQIQDITERVAAEKALVESREKSEALAEQFRQSQKMEAVGQLAAGVAHDFNNLLTIVVGYSELLLGSMSAGDANRVPIEEIRKAGDHAAALTRQLLAFGRKQLLAPVVVNLNFQLTETERMLRHLIGADIELITQLEPNLGSVLVDPGQIEQILVNLVINARDAMPTGGRISIRTENVVPAELKGHHATELPLGPYVMMSVNDTGCGMSEATKARIFEPFFTTKEVGKGSGLGLATVFGIVRQSGGFMEVDSALDLGSTFRVYLPQVLKQAAPVEQPSTLPLPAAQAGGETILLVEDEDAVRNLTNLILRSSGYNVLSTRHGGEALQLCHEYAGEIQLLFTDVVMPKMSGRQLADLLLPFRPTMKLLYMSGYTDDTMVRHGIREGTNFLAKPFTPVALTQKVREVLDGTQRRPESFSPSSPVAMHSRPASPVLESTS